MNGLFILELLAPPLVICLILTALHVYVGFHVLARGVLFVDLALAQIAALGATVALLAGYEHDSIQAWLFGLVATVIAAALFASTRDLGHRVPQEAIIGIIYAVASAVAVLLVDRAPHGMEHIKEILVGNLLAVTWGDVVRDLPIYAALGVFHFLFRRRFLTISMQPAEAAAKGWRLRWWDFLFYVAFGVMITTSVAIGGVLLVFAYLIVPAVIASLVADRLSVRLGVAWVTGVVCTFLGLWASFAFDFPTGATIVAVFGAALALVGAVLAVRPLFRRLRPGPSTIAIVLMLGSLRAIADPSDTVDVDAIAKEMAALGGNKPADPAPTLPPLPPPSSQQAGPSMNPNLSVILNVAAAGFYGPRLPGSEDDPQHTGINQQEAEIGLQAVADAYFRADVFLSIGGVDSFEVEEAYLTSLGLPAGLLLKAGVFRSSVGRQNGQHLEQLAFANRPLMNAFLFGRDGVRGPGVQLSYLVDFLPFFSTIYAEALSLAAPGSAAPAATFGGGSERDFVLAAAWENFFELSDTWSLLVGLNGATGMAPGADLELTADDGRSILAGADLYVKWRPLGFESQSQGVAFTAEYFVRRLAGANLGAGYGQLQVQLARRWAVAGRVDVLGGPGGETSEQSERGGLALTFKPTEFTSLRFQVDRAFAGRDETAAFLQLTAGIGPHGAHAF